MLVEYRKNAWLLSVRAQVKHIVMLTTEVYVYLLHEGTPYLVACPTLWSQGCYVRNLEILWVYPACGSTVQERQAGGDLPPPVASRFRAGWLYDRKRIEATGGLCQKLKVVA